MGDNEGVLKTKEVNLLSTVSQFRCTHPKFKRHAVIITIYPCNPVSIILQDQIMMKTAEIMHKSEMKQYAAAERRKSIEEDKVQIAARLADTEAVKAKQEADMHNKMSETLNKTMTKQLNAYESREKILGEKIAIAKMTGDVSSVKEKQEKNEMDAKVDTLNKLEMKQKGAAVRRKSLEENKKEVARKLAGN